MRIAHVFPYDPRHLNLTPQAWVAAQIARWPLAAIAISAFAAQSSVHVIGPESERYSAAGLDFTFHRSLMSGPKYRGWGDDWALGMERVVRGLGPADICVIHMNGNPAAIMAQHAARRTRKLIVFHGQGIGPWDVHPRDVDGWVVLSTTQLDGLLIRGADPNRIWLLRPSIDRSVFVPAVRYATVGNSRKLGFVGVVNKGKGAFEIPKVLRACLSAGLKPQVDVVGAYCQDTRDDLLSRCAEEGVTDRVKLWGHLGKAHVAELMRGWHLLLQPSYSEGFPIVVLESLAAGTAVAIVPGTHPSEMEAYEGVLVAPSREGFPQFVADSLRAGRPETAVCPPEWPLDHSEGARLWDETLRGVPEYSARPTPTRFSIGRWRRSPYLRERLGALLGPARSLLRGRFWDAR